LLINGTLLPGTEFLLLIDAQLQRFILSLEGLVGGNDGVDLCRHVSNFLVSGTDLNSDCLYLLRDLDSLLSLVSILVFQHFEFVLAAADD
jgi:hypothetical protein